MTRGASGFGSAILVAALLCAPGARGYRFFVAAEFIELSLRCGGRAAVGSGGLGGGRPAFLRAGERPRLNGGVG